MKIEVTLTDVFSGIGMTDAGMFGIAQRDGGIEVMLDGKTVYAYEMPGDDGGPNASSAR